MKHYGIRISRSGHADRTQFFPRASKTEVLQIAQDVKNGLKNSGDVNVNCALMVHNNGNIYCDQQI